MSFAAVIGCAVMLVGCAAPAPEDDPALRTAVQLELLVRDAYGEAYADELGEEWFARIAEDITENCDTPGFREGYLGSFSDQPDLADMIAEVWDTGCPD